ncbi:MAG: PKD domain-containing protein, partial [Bacteroidales bacterium]|nr:PKD domain-containing protein [Bacteroidales bacterium]
VNQNPTISDSKTSNGSAIATFNASLTGLQPGTTYYVRAYATNYIGTAYGDQVSFTSTTPPIADFIASFNAILPGGTVQFTDQSLNTPTSWSWEFGDGGTSTLQNPSHKYTTPGNYSVSLTVTNEHGSDSKTKADFITVSTLLGTIYTDGTGDNTTKGKGGQYLSVPLDILEDNDDIEIKVTSGTLVNVHVHLRTAAGNWYSKYDGLNTKFKVSDLIENQRSTYTHLVFCVNGMHEKYLPVACSAQVIASR